MDKKIITREEVLGGRTIQDLLHEISPDPVSPWELAEMATGRKVSANSSHAAPPPTTVKPTRKSRVGKLLASADNPSIPRELPTLVNKLNAKPKAPSTKRTEPNPKPQAPAVKQPPYPDKNATSEVGKHADKQKVKEPATKATPVKEKAKFTPPQEPITTAPPIKSTTPEGFADLWSAAAASKAKKPKESQVWLDNDLYRRIETINLKHGKPVPTKHLVNAMLKLFLDEHKAEIAKSMK